MSRTTEKVHRAENKRVKTDPKRGREGRRSQKFLRSGSRNGNCGRKSQGGEDVKEGRSRQSCENSVNNRG